MVRLIKYVQSTSLFGRVLWLKAFEVNSVILISY
jgi:hypothetical protein